MDTLADSPPIAPGALPRSESDLVDWLRLIRSYRVGTSTFLRLMEAHGSASAALAELPRIARQAGAGDYTPWGRDAAERELAAGRTLGARLVALGGPGYPALLARIPDPPPLVWMRGTPAADPAASVAIVGARNASALGIRTAAHLAAKLGEAGMHTVSGLARGIDTAAHDASLASGTTAVLAGGIDVIYPPENTALAERIAETGCLLSEAPVGLHPAARHFPRRNRIISGLTPGIVVVEGAAKSGSLITARTAAEQGREVMAVPGHPFDARAAGCNMLIRDGATLVRSAEDVLAALSRPRPARPVPAAQPDLPLRPAQARQPATPPLQGQRRDLPGSILNLLGPAPISEDALIRQLSQPPAAVLAALAALDLEGRLLRHAGGLVSSLPGA